MKPHVKLYFDKRRKNYPEKNCVNCGATFKPLTRLNKACSLKCLRDHQNKEARKVFNPIKCVICASDFTPVSVKNKYCSQKCKYTAELKARSKKPDTKICKVCQAVFPPRNSLDKFCSINCRVENMKLARSRRWKESSTAGRFGTKNPAFKHGLSVRGAKIDSTGMRLFHKNRDEYKAELKERQGFLCCERCGATGGKLETHHIVYRSEKPRHEYLHHKINLILVCVLCHNWFHKSKANRGYLIEVRNLTEYFGQGISK